MMKANAKTQTTEVPVVPADSNSDDTTRRGVLEVRTIEADDRA